MLRIPVIAVFFVFALETFPQETGSDFRYFDSLTYSLYEKGQWKELAAQEKAAAEKGIDYYYLRMRIAIAYFELKNYVRASDNFIKALSFNLTDPIALEYLFYCNFYSGKFYQAWAVLAKINEKDRSRIKSESSIKRNSLTIETYAQRAETESIVQNPALFFDNPQSGGSHPVSRSFINNAAYLSIIPGNRVALVFSYNKLVKENYLHYFDGLTESDLPDQRVLQTQFYSRLSFFSGNGLSLSPSFHFLSTRYPFPYVTYSATSYTTGTYEINTRGFATGLELAYKGGYFSYSAGLVYSDLDKTGQAQASIGLIYYPAGNAGFYLGTNLAAVYETAAGSQARFIPEAFLGLAIKDRIWLGLSGATGIMKNLTRENGLIVYNSADYLTEKYSLNISIPILKNALTLYGGAGISRSRSGLISFDGSYNSEEIDYYNFSITGGISWKF